MKLRWFLSGTVRQATEMCKHVRKLLSAQRDLLSPQAIDAVSAALKQTNEAINSNADKAELSKSMEELEKTANKWLKPYPHPEWRENVEVLLVAIAVAMAIRTFFLQPFKIPTGSMQPTLFGMAGHSLATDPNFKMPNTFRRVFDACVLGKFYHEWMAADDGEITRVGPPEHFLRFINKQTVWARYRDGKEVSETFWFTPEPSDPRQPTRRFVECAGLTERTTFRKGEPIIRFVDFTGDHLFVDRVTYNFRRPQRGEIIVFKTKDIPDLPIKLVSANTGEEVYSNTSVDPLQQDQFYIKRLVGLPGERVSIGNDRHVRINGQPLDASTSHFENLYSVSALASPPQESHYSGHVHYGMLQDENTAIAVRPKHYLVFGDNTRNSYDSRGWGDLPQRNVIGKSWFVYWPITFGPGGRFGWGQR